MSRTGQSLPTLGAFHAFAGIVGVVDASALTWRDEHSVWLAVIHSASADGSLRKYYAQ
jgi:hypothetical protein